MEPLGHFPGTGRLTGKTPFCPTALVPASAGQACMGHGDQPQATLATNSAGVTRALGQLFMPARPCHVHTSARRVPFQGTVLRALTRCTSATALQVESRLPPDCLQARWHSFTPRGLLTRPSFTLSPNCTSITCVVAKTQVEQASKSNSGLRKTPAEGSGLTAPRISMGCQ